MLKKLNIVHKLIAINIIIFIGLLLIKTTIFLFKGNSTWEFVLGLVSVTPDFRKLVFRFWTPLTYMFVQYQFWHILGNMLWLYFMGIILIRHITEKDFLALYLLGGFAGALIFLISYNIFPIFEEQKNYAILLGASGAVTAIVIALGTYKPNEEVYFFGLFKLKLVYIAVFMVVYDIFMIESDNSGGHFAHLGGALYGFIYGLQLKKGKNISAGFADFIAQLLKMEPRKVGKRTKFKVVKNDFRTKDKHRYNKTIHDISAEIDRILTKISKNGYSALSRKEKEFLKKYGKKYK